MDLALVKVNPVSVVTTYINGRLCKKEPAYIVAVTASTVLAGVWLWDIIFQPEDLSARIKRAVLRIIRKIPAVSRKVEKEKAKILNKFEKDALERCSNSPYILKLPIKGLDRNEVLNRLSSYMDQGDYHWKKGSVSGTVYHYDEKLIELLTEVYGSTLYTNPLHSDVFPGVVRMEAEIVKMTINLYNGGPNACGTMTSGGTESILMAIKAYRDYAIYERGVRHPEMVLPRTAHPAFDKAASYYCIRIRHIEVDSNTLTVPVKDVKRAINSNTIMIVGSAPNYPYGTMDDIEELAKLAVRRNVPLHVDCCLGGFLDPFMRAAGFEFPQFDFSLKGVTSISADTHKYGFAPKGSSVIMYSDPIYRQYQYCVTTDWPGGVYGSPSVNGSRSGGIIATCWATLMYHGVEGYIDSTRKIVNTTKYIERELRQVKNIYIFGQPATSVVALGSKDFHILLLGEKLSDLGWSLNPLQFPSGIHICVTYLHTLDGVAERFVKHVKECVAEIMKDPKKPVEGSLAVYGMSQGIPDRSLVGDFTKIYIDSMYLTPETKNGVNQSTGGHSL